MMSKDETYQQDLLRREYQYEDPLAESAECKYYRADV